MAVQLALPAQREGTADVHGGSDRLMACSRRSRLPARGWHSTKDCALCCYLPEGTPERARSVGILLAECFADLSFNNAQGLGC